MPRGARRTNLPRTHYLLQLRATVWSDGGAPDGLVARARRGSRADLPAGFRWSKAMKPVVTDRCMHAHVGFLAGEIHIEYADGCVVDPAMPQVVAIDPGHDGRVVGKEPVVLISRLEGDARAAGHAYHRH